MVASAVGLRFRDVVSGVDTIAAHRDIIKQHGRVWWGWWKKEFESYDPHIFDNFGNEVPTYIVNRQSRQMFLAQSTNRIINTKIPDEEFLIPSYYVNSAKRVHGWFLLTSIDQIEYDDVIANRFGDSTLIVLGNGSDASKDVISAHPQKAPSAKSSILHLSDIHFGADYEFFCTGSKKTLEGNKTLTDCLISDLTEIGLHQDIGAILITGDFTFGGQWDDATMRSLVQELTDLQAKLGVHKENLIILPGNHDITRYPPGRDIDAPTIAMDNQITYEHERNFRLFMNKLTGREWDIPIDYNTTVALYHSDVVIGVLNSCRILATEWTEYGYVGPGGLDIIAEVGKVRARRPTFKLIAMHHHLLPVNDIETPTKKGVTLSLDAASILEAAQKAGVHIVLHGHQHVPRLSKYQQIPLFGIAKGNALLVVSNGSAGTSRRPRSERNTYCTLTFSDSDVKLCMRELRPDGRPSIPLYDGFIGATPSLP